MGGWVMQLPLYLINSECRRWLLWRSIPQEGGKPRKVPYYANGTPRRGQLDSEVDLKLLFSYQEAKSVFDKGGYDGLGFALGPDGNGGYWQGIDLDNIDQHPELASLDLPGYIETSPSGKGKHAIGYGRVFESLGSNKSGIEAYCKGRYFTFTGKTNGISLDTPVDLADYIESALRPIHSKIRLQTYNGVSTNSTSILSSSIPYIKDKNDLQLLKPLTKEDFEKIVIRDLRLALKFIPSDDYELWILFGHALCSLGDDGFKLWNEWSSKSSKYCSTKMSKRWKTFKGDRTNYGVIFEVARRNGWENSQSMPEPNVSVSQDSILHAIEEQWEEVNVSKVLTDPPDPVQFLVDKWMPLGHLTLLAAHGGAGKSIFALQAAVCLSLGIDFMGKKTRKSRVLFFSAEDSSQIIRSRLARIFQHMKLNPSQVAENLKILDATGNPVLFAEHNSNGIKKGLVTYLYYELQKMVQSFSADILIIDNASDTFDANENERSRVRGFSRSLIKIGQDRKVAVLLLAHIDKQTARGDSNTEGYSGSTAWHNSARSRIFLLKENDKILTVKHQKSNHGILAEDILMTWTLDGLLCCLALPSQESVLNTIVSLVKKHYDRGNYISTSVTSAMNASRILRNDPEFPQTIRGNKELWSLLSIAENSRLLVRKEISASRGKTRQIYVPVLTAPSCSNIAGAVNTDPPLSSAPSTTGGVGEECSGE